LEFASEELRGDREVVLAAVKQNYLALQFASEKIRDNKKIILTVVQQNYNNIERSFRNTNLKKQEYKILWFASERLQKDIEILLTIVQQCSWVFKYIDKELQKNKEVVLAAVKRNGDALEYASEELRNDKEVVLAAVKEHSYTVQRASKKLLGDKLFLIECYRINKDTIAYNYFINKFDKLENGHFDNTFIEENVDILDLVQNKEQLCQYLLDNEKYEIIHKNEEISEYIKDKYKIIILSFDIINPIYNIEEKTEEEIKNKYREDFLKIYPESTLIFIE
jgi:hypothetical protein